MEIVILVYVCVAGLIGPTMQINDNLDKMSADLRSGAVAPIVVPTNQHIPWLTEKTMKACQEWAVANPDKKADCRP